VLRTRLVCFALTVVSRSCAKLCAVLCLLPLLLLLLVLLSFPLPSLNSCVDSLRKMLHCLDSLGEPLRHLSASSYGSTNYSSNQSETHFWHCVVTRLLCLFVVQDLQIRVFRSF